MYLLFLGFPAPRLKIGRVCSQPLARSLCGNLGMRILNVAEKNDAAKNIAALLSRGTAIKRNGFSPYNKIYEFDCIVFGKNTRMVMTSVSGHLKSFEYSSQFRNWTWCSPELLFAAPVKKHVKKDFERIEKTLENEIKHCSALIIWTDCDREGENIGFEVMEVCKAAKSNIQVHRAVFSEITLQSVERALRNLRKPDEKISNAVDVRMEFDLRTGSAFTRFQTLYLQRAFPNALNENLVSYGSCQFPTLGFVVERFKAISDFKPEKFWDVNVIHTIDDLSVNFQWKRDRLFDKLACEVLFDKCAEVGTATVEKVETKPKTKWRPKPLDTVGLQKLASTKLRISAKTALDIAERLYSKGLISYPRTETTCFSSDMDLTSLVQVQTNDANWGDFARKVLNDGPDPFQGKKSDEAHPPIHPIKYTNTLIDDDRRIYELIVRHFLACLSKHAEGLQTTVDIDIAGEKFSGKGLIITARNYLDVYPYEKWSDKEIHAYQEGQVFKPDISMNEGETTPPELLTETDLIALMEKHGIGTDATHADHIETIKARLYVGLQDEKYFVPRTLGMGLLEGYNNMGYDLAKPEMRAALEADLKSICDGVKSPEEVLKKHIQGYKEVFQGVTNQANRLAEAIQNYIQVEAVPTEPIVAELHSLDPVRKCPKCSSPMFLKVRKNGNLFFGCSAYPGCNSAIWLPSFVLSATVTKDTCPQCGPDIHLVKFKFKIGSCYYPPDHVGCIGGCDPDLINVLTFNKNQWTSKGEQTAKVQTAAQVVFSGTDDSGFLSNENESGSERPPNCLCKIPAVLSKVKKPGENHGREFYTCSGLHDSEKCSFFKWKDKKTKDRGSETVQSSEGLRCFCSLPCKRLKTTKEGPNKGRAFFTCGKRFKDEDKCNFFQWADTLTPSDV